MIVSLSKRTVFSIMLASDRLFRIPVHFFGRTFFCPGEEFCPACPFSRPKAYWYTCATMDKRMEVVEICDSLARAVNEGIATLRLESAVGVIIRGSRKSKRSVWDIDQFDFRADLGTRGSDKLFVDQLSALYCCPLGKSGEAPQDWFGRVKNCHIPLLAKCVIPA